ncbi:TMV resistance protein N-like [Neltuma alba]|uniref:TMV resistance protein N-like n=1 Tax=Neltuma alba TaxID=207710 RepID=UPI0010A36130|nr:TMV resistance protein N-like [Prosopis alba]
MLQRDNQDMKSWKDSLTEVANLSGWDYKDGPEAELIEVVVKELWTKSRSRLLPASEKPIGIRDKLEQLGPLFQIGLNNVQFVGKWGLPGVGKTRPFLTNIIANLKFAAFFPVCGQFQKEMMRFAKFSHSFTFQIEDTYEGKKITQNLCRKKNALLIQMMLAVQSF